MPQGLAVKLKEGLQWTFAGDDPIDTLRLFRLTWASSVMLEGRPVCCHGFLPGVTLWMKSDLTHPDMVPNISELYWAVVPNVLLQWIEHAPENPSQSLLLPCTEAYVTLDRCASSRWATVHFYRQYAGLPC